MKIRTMAISSPIFAPWVFVHTKLVATEVAGLRAGGLHEVEERFESATIKTVCVSEV